MSTYSPRRPSGRTRLRPAAFTLIEVLVTLALLLLVLATLLQFMTNADQVWKTAAVDPFADAESAFESISNHAAGATLETYQDYADKTGAFRTAGSSANFAPDHLARRSDLAFVCGPGSGPGGWLASSGRTTIGSCLFFVAPQGYTQTDSHEGLGHLLNALGYFVEFSDEQDVPAFILPATHRWRWRLKEVVQPSESLGIYNATDSLSWIQPMVQPAAPVSVLAENVAALIALPEGPAINPAALPANYEYDSRDSGDPLTRHQLPARLKLALVAIDEASALLAANQNGATPPGFIAPNLFTSAANFAADVTTLDANLTAQKIHHRIFQRDILLPAAAWTDTLSQ